MGKKRKNQRKDKIFAKIVMEVARDTLVTLEEYRQAKRDRHGDETLELETDEKGRTIVEPGDRPFNSTVVETLNGVYCYNDNRLVRHLDVILKILQEFNDEFWEDDEVDHRGASMVNLRRDRVGRAWADDNTIAQLCYLAIAMNYAEWSYPRKMWGTLKHELPYIIFTCPKRGEKLEETETETHEGQQNEHSTNTSPPNEQSQTH